MRTVHLGAEKKEGRDAHTGVPATAMTHHLLGTTPRSRHWMRRGSCPTQRTPSLGMESDGASPLEGRLKKDALWPAWSTALAE